MALNSNQKQALTAELNKQKFIEYLNRERGNIDEKNKFNHLSRILNCQKHEEDQLKSELQAKTHELQMEEMCERECKFAREMEQIKHKELTDMLMRQHLRENCPELRDLERQLKLAYTNKQLTIQIAEKQAEKLSEKIRIKQEREGLRDVWETQEEYDRKLEEEENLKKYQYKKELQDQMIVKEKQRRYMYDEFLKEKKMMDDIVERIYEEDQRNMLEKMKKMQRTREEMEKFKQAQEVWKRKKKEELELENQKIQEYLQTQATTIQKRIDVRKKQEAAKEAFCQKIAKDIFEEQQKIKERDEIMQDLLIEEEREAVEKRHRDEMEKQFRQRIEMQQSLERQIKEREEKLRNEMEEDRRYKQQLLDKVMEDERIDRLTAEKKRIKMLQLRKDIEEMMAARRQKHAEEMQTLKKLKELEDKAEENRQKIIEEERIKILQEHVDNLDGFIPKGLIKPTDLPYLSHRKQDNNEK